ncbi:MAG TPA: ATPase, partial [Roseiflexaceae bacterium]|nr:ATPase [Roseiflexaceae bacterium]
HLVRPLMVAADAGDAAARRIIVAHGEALGDYALAAARKVGLLATSFPLVLTGGVLRHPSPLLRDTLAARVRAAVPGAHAMHSRFEPIVGAVLLALEQAGISRDSELLQRLAATLPATTFFAT